MVKNKQYKIKSIGGEEIATYVAVDYVDGYGACYIFKKLESDREIFIPVRYVPCIYKLKEIK